MNRPWQHPAPEALATEGEPKPFRRLAGAFRKPTIRTSLIKIVVAALLPLAGLAIWQGVLTLNDSRELVASRLRANAWAIAESERDPFIISRHALRFAAQSDNVRDMGPRCSEVLSRGLVGATGIVNFLRTDVDGKAQCSVLPFTQGQDLSNTLWWRETQGQRQMFIAQPQIGTISKRAVLIMVLPMFTAEGEFDGTLSAGIDIGQLENSLKRKQTELPGVAFVTDRMGRPMATVGRTRFDRLENVISAQSSPGQATSGDGRAWTYVAAPLYSDELYVVYAEPYRDVTTSALSRIWPSALLPLLSICFVMLAIWIGTQGLIIRWLKKLQSLTARFARGDFRVELDDYARAPAEMNDFALDLHNMAAAIESQEAQLKTALHNQSALTKELNHRVKNNLQIVSSLLTLQGEKINDPVARAAIGQARSRIAALGLIHRLQYEADTGDIRGTVDMAQLFTELCAQLRSSFRAQGNVDLNCDVERIEMPVDQAIPASLFVVEAVTNSFQHAFAAGRSGQIDLSLQVSRGEVWLIVADDGDGFVADAPTGQMGRSLMEGFAEQLGGKLDVVSGPDGTAIELHFAVSAVEG